MGLIPAGNSDFFHLPRFVPWYVAQFTFHFFRDYRISCFIWANRGKPRPLKTLLVSIPKMALELPLLIFIFFFPDHWSYSNALQTWQRKPVHLTELPLRIVLAYFNGTVRYHMFLLVSENGSAKEFWKWAFKIVEKCLFVANTHARVVALGRRGLGMKKIISHP